MTNTATPDAVSLKPCPFCGSSELVTSEDPYCNWWIICDGCGAEFNDCSSKSDCVDKWNTRALTPAPAGDVPTNTTVLPHTLLMPKYEFQKPAHGTGCTTTARGELPTRDELARAMDPNAFDPDPTVRHRHCSPLSVEAAQDRALKEAGRVLALLAQRGA